MSKTGFLSIAAVLVMVAPRARADEVVNLPHLNPHTLLASTSRHDPALAEPSFVSTRRLVANEVGLLHMAVTTGAMFGLMKLDFHNYDTSHLIGVMGAGALVSALGGALIAEAQGVPMGTTLPASAIGIAAGAAAWTAIYLTVPHGGFIDMSLVLGPLAGAAVYSLATVLLISLDPLRTDRQVEPEPAPPPTRAEAESARMSEAVAFASMPVVRHAW